MQIVQYLTYSTFSGKEPTLENAKQLLSKLDSRQVLASCCTIGILLQFWKRQGADAAAYRGVVERFFEPEAAAKIMAQFPAFQVFSRRQLLAIERLAIENYQENKSGSFSDFGAVSLMVNDFLHFGLAGTEVENEKVMRNLFIEMIPITEDAGSSIFAKTSRTATLIEEIAPSLKSHSDYLDINAEFYSITGLTLLDFQAICAAMLTKWVQFDVVKRPQPTDIFMTESWFNSTTLDKAGVEKTLSLLSAELKFYSDAFASRAKRREDFTPFRERPLLKVGTSGYLPSDLINLAESFEAFPFWTVNKKISSSKKPDQLFGFWGAMFEQYVNRITQAIANPNLNECLLGSEFAKDGEQVCDLLVRCGSDLVLIEAKGIMIVREAKYSGDASACFKEIERKFVHNEHGKNKGVSQLHASITRLFADKEPTTNIDLTGITRVFPVLITLDSIGDNPLFSNILNLYFDAAALSKTCGVAVEKVLGIGIENYEYMTTYLSSVSLADLLSDWLANPPTPNWIGSYAMIDSAFVRSLGEQRNPYIYHRFKEVTDRVERTLFPKLSSSPASPRQDTE